MNLNNKGFSAVEFIITSGLGALLLLSALFTPFSILKQFSTYSKSLQTDIHLQNLVVQLRSDILKAGETGEIINGNQLVLENQTYTFLENETSRNDLILFKQPLTVSFESNRLTLRKEVAPSKVFVFYGSFVGVTPDEQ